MDQALIDEALEYSKFIAYRDPDRLKLRIAPERIDPIIKPIKQLFIGPFEVKHQAQGLTHQWILEFLSPQIENIGLCQRQTTIPKLGFDHMARFNCAKVVRGSPLL